MNLFSDDLNLPVCDGKKCLKCGAVPSVHFYHLDPDIEISRDEFTALERENMEIVEWNKLIKAYNKTHSPKAALLTITKIRADRTSRVDCDCSSGDEESRIQVFCVPCYEREVKL